MYSLNLISGNLKIKNFISADLTLTDKSVSADDDEEFPLSVMPMLTLGNSGLGDIHAELTAAFGSQKLGEATSRILIHF